MSLCPEDLRKPAWTCVHFLPAREWKEAPRDLYVAKLTGTDFRSEELVMSAIAKAFDFPGGFGMNWDAVADYLRDLSWLSAPGYVLTVRDAGTAWRSTPLVAGKLTTIWLFSAEAWAEAHVSFHLVWVV